MTKQMVGYSQETIDASNTVDKQDVAMVIQVANEYGVGSNIRSSLAVVATFAMSALEDIRRHIKGEPIPMRIHCPECGKLHIDENEFVTKVHHTHTCQFCGAVFRPAVVPTVGVRFLPGFKNDVF